MNKIEEVRNNRERFLVLLYEKTNQDTHLDVNFREIASELGLDEDETWKIFEYLKGNYLADARVMGGFIHITINGIERAEKILSESGVDAANSQQVMNLIHVENMSNSQINQGSTNTTQLQNITQSQGANLAEFVSLFEEKLNDIFFESVEDKNEAIGEVSTIKAQLASPKPKYGIISQAGQTVKSILEKAAGSMVADKLLELLGNSL